MSEREVSEFDTLDVFLLGTVGLGTVLWFARHYIYQILFGRPAKAVTTTPAAFQPAPKRERNFVKIMKEQNRRVIFFYGSQTGTAEDYASRLAKKCTQRYGINAMTADIELYDLTYLDTVPSDFVVVFVMATYGEGEPTDNGVDFWELITEGAPDFSQSDNLSNLRYLVFGLGNKTYQHYNAVGRTIDRQLTKLGAKRIGERGEGDDDGSLEEDFLAWQETMWPSFCEAMGVDESNAHCGPRQASFKVVELESYDEGKIYHGELAEHPQDTTRRIVYGPKRPFVAPITTRELFNGGDRHCLHIDIDISGTNLSYQTGDHVAIWPTNNEAEVHRLATVLGLGDKMTTVLTVEALDPTASKEHPFPVPSTYLAIFRHYLDIGAVASRETLASLVEYAPTEASKAFLGKLASDKDEYRLQVAEPVRNLGEVLELVAATELCPGFFASMPFDLVIENLSRLHPRYYSISSSSKEHPKVISATCIILEYSPSLTPTRTVYGVNTNFLYQIHAAAHKEVDGRYHPPYDLEGPRQSFLVQGQCSKVPIHVRQSHFRLPRNPAAPVILIGPGTGVAPFRGFIHERALKKKEGVELGPTLLFYGCRHSQQDFLYGDEWPALFEALGPESGIITAFSRETAHKVYVQHRLEEHGERVWQLLQSGAYVYVCGDAKNMARDVLGTFVSVVMKYGQKSQEKASEYFKMLKNTNRYQEDVWS